MTTSDISDDVISRIEQYLELSQFELARALIREVFHSKPHEIVHMLRELILTPTPALSLFPSHGPNPTQLAWLAYLEHNRLYDEYCRALLPSGSVNQLGFISHDSISFKLLEARQLVARSPTVPVKFKLICGDFEYVSCSAKGISRSWESETVEIPVIFANSQITLLFLTSLECDEAPTVIGKSTFNLIQYSSKSYYNIWTSLSVPAASVPLLTQARNQSSEAVFQDIDFGRINVQFEWNCTHTLDEYGLPAHIRDTLNLDLLLSDVLNQPVTAQTILGKGMERKHVISNIREYFQRFAKSEGEASVNLTETEVVELFTVLAETINASPILGNAMSKLLCTVQEVDSSHLLLFDFIYLQCIRMNLHANRFSDAATLLGELARNVGPHVEFPQYQVFLNQVYEIFFRYIHRSDWESLCVELLDQLQTVSPTISTAILRKLSAINLTDCEIKLSSVHQHAELYRCLLTEDGTGGVAGCDQHLIRNLCEKEDVFFLKHQITNHSLPLCFEQYYARTLEIDRVGKHLPELESNIFRLQSTIDTTIDIEKRATLNLKLEEAMEKLSHSQECFRAEFGVTDYHEVLKTSTNEFMSVYLTFVRLQKLNVFEYPVLSALSFAREGKWEHAEIAIRPFPSLRPLFVLLCWDQKAFRGKYHSRLRLVQSLWADRPKLIPHEGEMRLSCWCNQLELYLKLIEVFHPTLPDTEKMHYMRRLETESIVKVFGKDFLMLPDTGELLCKTTVLEWFGELTLSEDCDYDGDILKAFFSLQIVVNAVQCQYPRDKCIDAWRSAALFLRAIKREQVKLAVLGKLYCAVFIRKVEAEMSLRELVDWHLTSTPVSINEIAEGFCIRFETAVELLAFFLTEMSMLQLENAAHQGLQSRLEESLWRVSLLDNSKESDLKCLLWLLVPVDQLRLDILRSGRGVMLASDDPKSVVHLSRCWGELHLMMEQGVSENSIINRINDMGLSPWQSFSAVLDLISVFKIYGDLVQFAKELLPKVWGIDKSLLNFLSVYLDELSNGKPVPLSYLNGFGWKKLDSDVHEYNKWIAQRKRFEYREVYADLKKKNILSLRQAIKYMDEKVQGVEGIGYDIMSSLGAVRYLLPSSKNAHDLKSNIEFSQDLVERLPDKYKLAPAGRWMEYRIEKYLMVLEFITLGYVEFNQQVLDRLALENAISDSEAFVALILATIENLVASDNDKVARLQFCLAFCDRELTSENELCQTILRHLLEVDTDDPDRLYDYIVRINDGNEASMYTRRFIEQWRTSVSASKYLLQSTMSKLVTSDKKSREEREAIEYLFQCLSIFEDITKSQKVEITRGGVLDSGSGSLDWIQFSEACTTSCKDVIVDLIDASYFDIADNVFAIWKQYHKHKVDAAEFIETEMKELILVGKLSCQLSRNSTMQERAKALDILASMTRSQLEPIAVRLISKIDDGNSRWMVSEFIRDLYDDVLDIPGALLVLLQSSSLFNELTEGVASDVALFDSVKDPRELVRSLVARNEMAELQKLLNLPQLAELEYDSFLLQGAKNRLVDINTLDIDGALLCYSLAKDFSEVAPHLLGVCDILSNELFVKERRFIQMFISVLSQLLTWCSDRITYIDDPEVEKRLMAYTSLILSPSSCSNLIYRIYNVPCSLEILYGHRAGLIKDLVNVDSTTTAIDVEHLELVIGSPEGAETPMKVEALVDELQERCREMGTIFGLI